MRPAWRHQRALCRPAHLNLSGQAPGTRAEVGRGRPQRPWDVPRRIGGLLRQCSTRRINSGRREAVAEPLDHEAHEVSGLLRRGLRGRCSCGGRRGCRGLLRRHRPACARGRRLGLSVPPPHPVSRISPATPPLPSHCPSCRRASCTTRRRIGSGNQGTPAAMAGTGVSS